MRNPAYEEWLTRRGYTWRYVPSVQLDTVRADKSLLTQVRLSGVVDAERVAAIAAAVRDGDADLIDPLLLRGDQDAPLLLGGHHRAPGLIDGGRAHHDAYFVDVDDPLAIRVLALEDNGAHGKGYDTEEAMIHAAHLHNACGYSVKDAAATLRVDYDKLQAYIRAEATRSSLLEGGMPADAVAKFKDTPLLRIHTVRRRDQRVAVARLVHEAKLSVDEQEALISAVRGAESDRAAHETVESWRERLEARIQKTRGGKVRPPRRPLQGLVSASRRVRSLAKTNGNIAALTIEERRQIAQECEETAEALLGVAGALAK